MVPSLIALFVASFLVTVQSQSPQSGGPQGRGPVVPQQLRDKAARDGRVRVIVQLRLPGDGAMASESAIARQGGAAAVNSRRQDIADARARVLARMAQGFRETRRFQTVPFVAVEVDANALNALESSPDVLQVRLDGLMRLSLEASVPRIEGDQVWQVGFNGAGTTVAIIDSGVDAAHPFFGGRVVEEACFSSTSAGISQSVCPNGEGAQIGAGAAAPCEFEECLHGTHVAGIAAGNGAPASVPFSGVAPGAEIIAVQVFSSIIDGGLCGGNAPCLGGFESDIIAGLEHVYGLKIGGRNVAAVNMSLGGGDFDTTCDDEPFKPAIDNLRGVGVATIVASGNNGQPGSLSSPACISSAISVGASTLDDQVAWFSNVSPFLSLFAPGDYIVSSIPGDDYAPLSGTSMASPHVAGAWAVMRQAVPSASIDDLLAAFRNTGQPVTDTRDYAPGTTTVPRIRMFAALASLGPITSPAPSLSSVTPLTARAGLPATLTLTGSGFNALSVVRWNGVDVPTVADSITQLTAQVPAAMVQLGTAQVTVFNPAPGGGTSAALPVEVMPPPSLSVSATSIGPGANITVTLTNGFGGHFDWLALAPAGGADGTYIASSFVPDGVFNTTWTLQAPTTAGSYEFRLFLNNGFVRVATSPVFVVDDAVSPVPVLQSMSHTEAVAGSPAFTLTVLGGQFRSHSVVSWNGSPRPTTFVNTTQLTATISAADLATAGAVPVTVVTPAPGGGTSAALTFTVRPAPSLAVSASSVVAGSNVTVTLSNGLGGSLDWIAFAQAGSADNTYVQSMYVGAGVTTTAWTVTAPATAGTYEFRLFKQGSFIRAATSPSVTVTPPPSPVLTVSPTTVNAGQSITVTLTNGLGGNLDWLSFAQAGSANNSYVQQTYVGAGVTTRTWTVTAPSTGGSYEFRLFQNGGFVRLATSPVVTVNGPPPPPVLTVSPSTVVAGGSVTVTLTNSPGGAQDFLTFAQVGSANNAYVQQTLVGAGVTSRTWTVTAASAGQFEFRLFQGGGFTRLGTSPTVNVTSSGPPALTVSASTILAGQSVTVTLANGPGNALDWLAFAPVGAANNSYVQFTYVGGGVTNRTWTVTAPTTPGQYEFRLFQNGGFTRLATSPAVTVQAPPPPVLTVSTTTAGPGQTVTVTLTNGLGGPTDWLSFAAVGSAENVYVTWTYVGAGVTTRTWTVTMPSTPGAYEFRLYRQASFIRIATSVAVQVQ
jgi:subtilisin family serine protease